MKVGVITSVFLPLIDNAYRFYGGMEIRTLSLIEYLSEKGHDVHVFATKDSSLHIKNVTLHTGDYPIWDGKRIPSYEAEKNIIMRNLDILKSCDAVLEDNHFHFYNYLASREGFKQNIAMSWDFYPQNAKLECSSSKTKKRCMRLKVVTQRNSRQIPSRWTQGVLRLFGTKFGLL